jgi:Ca2+-binding EF-hand superfamily protein
MKSVDVDGDGKIDYADFKKHFDTQHNCEIKQLYENHTNTPGTVMCD